MTDRYLWQTISRATARQNNQVYQKHYDLSFQLAEEKYSLHFVLDKTMQQPCQTVKVQINEQITFDLCLESEMLFSILHDFPHMDDPAALPEAIRSTALEVALERLLDRIDHFCGCRSTIIQFALDSTLENKGLHLFFKLIRESDGVCTHGCIHSDTNGMQWIVDQLSQVPKGKERQCDPIPLTGSIEIGQAMLPLSDIRALAPHDIVIAEVVLSQDIPEVLVRFSPCSAISGSMVQPDRILVQDLLTHNMEKPIMAEKRENKEQTSDSLVDDIPVTLVFELGKTSMRVGELKQIQPGFTLQLDEALDLAKPVTIKANGINIGMGEIIQIEDQLGIRVLEFTDEL